MAICCMACLANVSCTSTTSLLGQGEKENVLFELKNDLLGSWKVEEGANQSPLNSFSFGYNERDQFEMRVNNRLVQMTNIEVVGPLDFLVSFKGLDYSELYLLGKFQSYEKKVLLLINSDKENNSYETIQNIRLIRQ